MACAAVELIIDVVGRRWWAGEIEIWQEVEMERRKGKGSKGDKDDIDGKGGESGDR
jgi:hypothetical protein